jgi:hypothetical protein
MNRRTVSPLEPYETLSSIFTARRDLMHGVKAVVAGSGFTIEEADLLVSLYGACELGWDDLPQDQGGFVPFNTLEEYLVHNPSLLSRRIAKLASTQPPLLEVASGDPTLGQHFNSKRVRITAEGGKRVKPVWKRYQQLAVALLKGIPQRMLENHHAVNSEISAQIRARRNGLRAVFADNP